MAVPLALYPSLDARRALPNSQWSAILSSWTAALSFYLQLPDSRFSAALSEASSLVTFLRSYVFYASKESPDEDGRLLWKKVFLTVHRALSISPAPEAFLTHDFLFPLAGIYYRVPAFRELLGRPKMQEPLAALKTSFIPQIKKGGLAKLDEVNAVYLFSVSPAAAAVFLAGDDFADAMVAAGGTEKEARIYGRALLSACKENWSVVIDGLYALVSTAERNTNGLEACMVRSLVEMGVVERLILVAESSGEKRVAAAVGRMNKFSTVRRKKKSRRDKGKGKAAEMGFAGEEEADIMSKVDVIKELFPDIADAAIKRVLQAHSGDIEAVTQAILENDLPLPDAEISALPNKNIPMPPSFQRHNQYDHDDLDTLSSAALQKLSLGSRRLPDSVDSLPGRVDKSKILSALAAFDSDDDERDDTYDAADVGGVVDISGPPGEEDIQKNVRDIQNVDVEGNGVSLMEKLIYDAWKHDRAVFSRDAATKRSVERKKLREQTGWTDEALEGWSFMLQREPSRMRKLEKIYQDADAPQQVEIQSTRWRDSGDDQGTGSEGGGRGRGRGRGPGRGRDGRGKGGSAGTGGGPDPTRERRKDEQNKASRANHNRRDQRARKLAKGGFAG